MRTRLTAAAFVLGASIIAAQSKPGSASPSTNSAKPDPWSQLPAETLVFSKPIELSGIPQSPAIIAPLECSPEGTAFVQVLLPPTFISRAYVGISKAGKATVYARGDTFPGFSESRQLDWYPGDKHVYALIEGRKSNSGGDPTPWGETVLKFAENGALEAEVKLEPSGSFSTFKFAALPSGKLIVIGKSTLNQTPELLLLDSSGGNPHMLDIFGSGLYSDEKLRTSIAGDKRSPSSSPLSLILSSVQFVPYGEDILLVQTGTNYPIAEIGEGGIRRAVSLSLPKGVTIESFLPSPRGSWYVRLVDNRKGDRAHIMMVFDPQSGEALRRVYTQQFPLDAVACKTEGAFLALRQIPQKGSDYGAFALFTAPE